MKVLFISGSYPPIHCGIGYYMARLESSLDMQDYRIITSSDAKEVSNVLPVISSWGLPSITQVIRETRAYKPDIVHVQYPSIKYGRKISINLLPACLRIRFPRSKIVVTVHEYHDASRLGKIRVLLTAAFAHRVVVSNQEDAKGLRTSLFWKKQAIGIVPIGSNIPIVKASRVDVAREKSKYVTGGQKLIAFIGLIDQLKGVEGLMEAASRLDNVKVVIGSDYNKQDSYQIALKKMALQQGGKVEWTGFLSDTRVSLLLQAADLIVLPFERPASLRRGTVLAALTHGGTLVTTGPALPPLVHRKNCFLIADNSASAISSACQELLSSAALAKLISEGAKELSRDFEWSEIAKKHKRIYAALL